MKTSESQNEASLSLLATNPLSHGKAALHFVSHEHKNEYIHLKEAGDVM